MLVHHSIRPLWPAFAAAILCCACATSSTEISSRLAQPDARIHAIQEDQLLLAHWALVRNFDTDNWNDTSEAFVPIVDMVVQRFEKEYGPHRIDLFEGDPGPRNIDVWNTDVLPDSLVGDMVVGVFVQGDYWTTSSKEFRLTLTSSLRFAEIRKGSAFGAENVYTRAIGNLPVKLGQVVGPVFSPPRQLTKEGLLQVFPTSRLAAELADSTRAGLERFFAKGGGSGGVTGQPPWTSTVPYPAPRETLLIPAHRRSPESP